MRQKPQSALRASAGPAQHRAADPVRPNGQVEGFLAYKTATLRGRAQVLAKLDAQIVGLRLEDRPYAPSSGHFAAVNDRLAAIKRDIDQGLNNLRAAATSLPGERLLRMAMVEREIDRARRAFGLFFEVFAQRGAAFAPSLAAHDRIARDCYAAARRGGGDLLAKPLLPPLTYLEHGYSPATMRRGVTLERLLGTLPFPLIRIPWDRDKPWQATFLHEVAHNLQADLRLWEENRQAVARRLARTDLSPGQRQMWQHQQKEIFADLAAMLLGGPVSAWGMAEFLAHPKTKVASYRSGSPHPPGYLRVLIMAEMAQRMGFDGEAQRLRHVWRQLYAAAAARRLPPDLRASAASTIPILVDEIAFQPRRALAERALANILRFTADDQRAIREGAKILAGDRVPPLPPRFLVSAASYAIAEGAPIPALGARLIRHLTRPAARFLPAQRTRTGRTQALAA
jgi:hypothetical protein